MVSEHDFNPQLIEGLAAEAFWSFAFKHSTKIAISPLDVDDEIIQEMLSHEVFPTLLSKMGVVLEDGTPEIIDSLKNTVAECIVEHNRIGENIIGAIFQEDFSRCKNPNFQFEELIAECGVDSDDNSTHYLKFPDDKPEYIGDLILRTPLPAGILLKKLPRQNPMVCIPDTRKACYFQKTLILPITKISPLPPNSFGYNYFASGIFHIPATKVDSPWLKLIPNATAFLSNFELHTPDHRIYKGEITKKGKVKTIVKQLLKSF